MVKEQGKTTFLSIIKAMGLVFGDIGTSPIYTLTVVFLTVAKTYENIIGILSLIIWTLILIVSVQYAWLAMNLSHNGEGGSVVLNQILKKYIKNARSVTFFSFLTYLAVSLLIGDSIITPAISILSAVEGLKYIPAFQEISHSAIIITTIIITILLFSIQKKGTDNVSKVFGPIMLLWFILLAGSGIYSFAHNLDMIVAFNPYHALYFLTHNGLAGFFVLSEIILCATGGEALYADMGHLGKKPIIYAWAIVFVALIFNYCGQCAFLTRHPDVDVILFAMVKAETSHLIIPFLIVTIAATIIASQAMISGMFSIIYQCINTRILPMLKINYTSEKINSQIYIGAANGFLFLGVIFIILFFQYSSKLAAAYGLAVSGTMTITAIMMITIYLLQKKYLLSLISAGLFVIDSCFFVATCSKFPHGAYWAIIAASIPFTIILLYIYGNKKLYNSMIFMERDVFLEKYQKIVPNVSEIKGTALFFSRGIDKIPSYVIQTMFTNNIFYSDNIFVQISKTQEAFGVEAIIESVIPGIRVMQIKTGYMEFFSLEKLLKETGVKEKVIFYGVEDIESENIIWKIFALIRKTTPTFVSFYNLPAHKIHGVVTKVIMKN